MFQLTKDMADLPKEYKACCYNAPGKNSIEIRNDMQVPEPGPGQVLINLCALDISLEKSHIIIIDLLERTLESAIPTTQS